MTQLARTFAALSDTSRLSIVETLMQHGELPAGVLASDAPVSGPAISRHLKVLREAGLITMRKHGPLRLYSIAPNALAGVSDWLDTHREFWTAGLDRLAAHLGDAPHQDKD